MELYQRHVPLERIERAYLLGCTRKYVALLNHPSAALISSLHYFTALLGELEELNVSPDYWSYLSHKMDGLEQSWQRDSAAVRVGPANFASPNRRLSNPRQRRNEMMMTDRSGEETTPMLDRSRSLRRR